ncbi:MAG: DUF4040 domain-containing protein [Draconibacterium sp.]|nr:DUF4040 domain-containing protein [Draconibacterium sp.]
MTYLVLIIGFLLLVLIGAAIYAVYQRDLLYAVIATGIISLVLTALFFILQAPDVALTEAAIGVALTTIIFIITIRNTERFENEGDKKDEQKSKTE